MENRSKAYNLPAAFIPPHKLSGKDASSPILVAFSGGADSGALLDMAVQYARGCGADIYAAHVNHCIRGDEADADEEFCRRRAESYGIEIFTLRADVPAIAEREHKSIETAARELRYSFFSDIMQKKGIETLCVAHNADDNFETILFNISRGSGLSGVCGIPQTRDIEGGVIVRPILSMSRSEILEYCRERGIEYVTDSTNTDTDYTRNRIREKVVPELKAICPGAEQAAARLSDSLRADALCLDSMAEWFLSQMREGFSIETEKLCGSPYAVASRAVMTLYGEISGGESLEYVHLKAIFALAEKSQPHSSLNLPHGIYAAIENGRLIFSREPLAKAAPAESFFVEIREGVNTIEAAGAEIVMGDTQKSKNIYKKSIKLSIDCDKISGAVFARERRAGDKIKIGGMSKSIKKLMCDKKIPISLRPRIPIICDSEGVIAVPFIGVADRCSAAKTRSQSPTCLEFGII